MRASPHRVTGETANFLMLGREVRLPHHLTNDVGLDKPQAISLYAQELIDRMQTAQQLLWNKQVIAQTLDSEEPPLFKAGEYVWLKSYRMETGKCAKLQPKFVGPYVIIEVLPFHTYQLKKKIDPYIGNLLAKTVEKGPWDTLCVDLIGPYTIERKGKYEKKKRYLTLWCITMIDPVTS